MRIEYFFYFIRQVRIDFRQAFCQIFVYGTFGNTKLFRNDTNGFFRLHDILTNLDCSLFDVIVHTTRPPQLDVRSVK